MALYGASYGIVSLGCTLPIFLAYVAGTLTAQSLPAGLAVFAAYTAGFATLIGTLSLALAFARRSMVTHLRRVLPYIQRVSGGLLVLAGLYVAYFGWYELNRLGESDPIIDRVMRLAFDLQGLIFDLGVDRFGGWIAAAVGTVAVGVLWRFRPRSRSADVTRN